MNQDNDGYMRTCQSNTIWQKSPNFLLYQWGITGYTDVIKDYSCASSYSGAGLNKKINTTCYYNKLPTYSYKCTDYGSDWELTTERGSYECKRKTNEEESKKICEKYLCKAYCENFKTNNSTDLTSCIKNTVNNGITLNNIKYSFNWKSMQGAYNYCYVQNDCYLDCNSTNEALQQTFDDYPKLKACVLNNGDKIINSSISSVIQTVESCKSSENLCKSKCYTTNTPGNQPSCSNKYDISQSVIYNELETKEETNINICNNQSPRVSKYGRLIGESGNCKLYCRQKESKVDLPTNILNPMWRLSYFEWPTKDIGNHLKIETINQCYIFTAKLNEEPSNCSFDENKIFEVIKSKDNATIKLHNGVTLTSLTSKELTGTITINKNTDNPQSFEFKTTTTYKIPVNGNNILSVQKSNKTLTNNLLYGVIKIPKNETIGQHDLKLTVSNYGFSNQFGEKVNGYTCHYNVTKHPSIITICEKTDCKGELILNNNYRTYNNKVQVKSYTNKESKICNLGYTCKNRNGMENALESCVMSYYADKDWIYDVSLLDTARLDSALKHCSNLCNNEIEQVVFRKISPSEPFPGIKGSGRVPGTNWIGFEEIAKESDKTKPIYEITLTSENIKNIRDYNKANDYDDWTISDSNGLSTFIRNTKYIKSFTYNKPTTISGTTKCVKIETPPQPVIKWDDSLKKLRNDGNGYKKVQLIGLVKESTGKTLNLESGKYCITTGDKCEPNKSITPINNKITPPELTTNSSKQRICAIVKDKGGSESEVSCSEAYKVDTTPELDVVFTTTSTATNGWYKNLKVNVILSDDNHSSLEIHTARYCITQGTSCNPVIIATPGKDGLSISSFSSEKSAQNICVRLSTTGGRNITKCSGQVYKFDNTKPSAPTISNPSNQACVAGPIVLTVGSKDEHSGIDNYQYTYSPNATTVGSNNGTQWIMYTNSAKPTYDTTPYSAQRNQYTYIRACDKAGNCSDKSQTYIRIGTAKKSDTECYTSVQAAINDGNNGTVTMLRDSTENVSIASNKSLIIDMNGKTLNGSLTNNGSIWIQGNGKINTSGTAINNNGSLTVKNGTFGISTTGTNAGLINSGNCLIESGTFRAINTIQNKKTMSIKGGTFQASDTAIWQTDSGTALWMYGGNITSANIFAIYNQSTHAIVAYNVNAIEKTNQGYIIRINKLSSNTYNVAVFGSSITSCPSWPTNSNNPHWYDALTHSDGQGTYKYCRIYNSDYSNPNNTWNTHLYNNGSKTAELNGWTWK